MWGVVCIWVLVVFSLEVCWGGWGRLVGCICRDMKRCFIGEYICFF